MGDPDRRLDISQGGDLVGPGPQGSQEVGPQSPDEPGVGLGAEDSDESRVQLTETYRAALADYRYAAHWSRSVAHGGPKPPDVTITGGWRLGPYQSHPSCASFMASASAIYSLPAAPLGSPFGVGALGVPLPPLALAAARTVFDVFSAPAGA